MALDQLGHRFLIALFALLDQFLVRRFGGPRFSHVLRFHDQA
jgi:hypothetical protein